MPLRLTPKVGLDNIVIQIIQIQVILTLVIRRLKDWFTPYGWPDHLFNGYISRCFPLTLRPGLTRKIHLAFSHTHIYVCKIKP
jgi:hypothetical protein